MKIINILLGLSMTVGMWSCDKKEVVNPGITYEAAMGQQVIEYDFQERHYKLTELKENDWPFNNPAQDENIFETVATDEVVFSRYIYADVPAEQAGEDHIETFSIQIAQLVTLDLIDTTENRFISNDNFQTMFLELGDMNSTIRKTKVNYQQTYRLSTVFEPYETVIALSEITEISDMENAFLLSGTFETLWTEPEFENLENGTFKIILKN